MHGRLVRRTWRDFCCKSSWPGEWTLPARCCMLLEWGFHGSRPRCDVEPLWKVVAYRTWRSPEVGKPAPGTLEFYHTCLREFKFLEQSGTGDQADCLLGNFLQDYAIDSSKESHGVLKLLDVNAGIWFWSFFFREFGCSLHPFRVGEAELDPFYPLSFAIMKRNLHVASRQRRRSPGVVSRVWPGMPFFGPVVIERNSRRQSGAWSGRPQRGGLQDGVNGSEWCPR